MALQKQPVSINFSRGVDTKTDPYQLQVGSFLSMQNSVFNNSGRLTKRNGFAQLTTLPATSQTTLTTLNNNLIATGSNLYAYSADTQTWLNQGATQPVNLSTLPLLRSSTGQSAVDMTVAPNGLACFCYIDSGQAYYQISDSTTGQQIIARQALDSSAITPRVFVLGQRFMVVFLRTVSANLHLSYRAINLADPTVATATTDIATGLLTGSTAGWDGVVANNSLYLAWPTTVNTLNLTSISSTLVVATPTVIPSATANLLTIATDSSSATPNNWIVYWDSTGTAIKATKYSANNLQLVAPLTVQSSVSIKTLTAAVLSGSLKAIYEVSNTYGSGPNTAVRTNYIAYNPVSSSGTAGSQTVVLRSVGLASKAFVDSNAVYMLCAYGETNQPTYFLNDLSGNIYMRLAYSNGGGYETTQVLPAISFLNSSYYVLYLYKDLLTSINTNTNNATGTPTAALYTQTGINLAKFSLNQSNQYSTQIAGALQLTGGIMWQYDGVKPVELGFNVWPENVAATSATTGGFMTAQKYYYQVCYEWTDNTGNIHRSAPSIPLLVDVGGSGTSTNSVTLYIPTLRLTYKTGANPVRLVVYRWSTSNQIYYQVTSVTSPLVNNPAVDLLTYTDTLADSSIIGNTILYTTGGVLENIAPPATVHSTLFNNRLFLIDAEDPNLLWYSKQVIENTPVETSDLLTIYVSPTTGTQGSTGPMTALSAMDDKLIVFKKDAIYYVNGIGPDNTGANSGYSDPVYITAAVGCSNPNSIVLTPAGLMFQSDKGIWILGRDLSTNYIGAAVEAYNSQIVQSAQSIPGTNQVRFILSNSLTLMYDYFYNQWGTFSNLNAISSTIYNSYQTYLNTSGVVYQETPGTYLDGSQPVTMSVTTGWINIAGLQGFERFYQMYLLGTYYSPFKLSVSIAYDYNSSALQQTVVTPDNYSPSWGGEAQWGAGNAWGGPGNVFEARVFPQNQKCESFQITIQEAYDPSYGASSAQGLTLSGLNVIVGVKKGYRTSTAAKSFG